MQPIRKIEKGESAEGYASSLAYQLFKGITRDTGLPYTHDHLAKLALLTGELTLQSKYQDALIAAAWLHDAAEDIENIDVFNPFEKEPKKEGGVVYLNDLFANAGEIGEFICFVIDLMTHRKGALYQDYVYKIFTFPEKLLLKDLHILAGALKMADIRLNTNPDERKNVNKCVEDYFSLRNADEKTLEAFYSRTKTIDAFRKKGSMEFDVGLFVEALIDGFKQKQRAIATDNICQYLPLAEHRLLIEVGKNNGLFNWQKLRSMLKSTYTDSLRCYPGSLYDIKRMGINRKAPKVPGYASIFTEIRQEAAKGFHWA
ncbi:MAG: hypothetical protein KJ955_00250 [Nanoarchaeota archaeon]|nr:hypothetical protein [Nanoarchaeota archaeon]